MREFREGRQWIVWALERTAIWKDLFPDSAAVLLALAEEENANNANNASGVFAGLFSLLPGRMAPTEADPADRLPVLRDALDSVSKDRRLLGLKACKAALERNGSRMVGAEHQGLRQEPRLWNPDTHGDVAVAIRAVWEMLIPRIDALDSEERAEALVIVLQAAQELLFMETLARMVLETFRRFRDKPYVEPAHLLRVSLDIKRRSLERMPEPLKTDWLEFCDELTGQGFSAGLRRYVGISVFEDEYDEKGTRISFLDEQIASLADQAIADSAKLDAELGWLIAQQTDNAYRFGYQLSKRDSDHGILKALLEAQSESAANGNTALLGGYLRAVFEQDAQVWETILDRIEADATLRPLLAEIVAQSGMSDRAAQKILASVKEGAMPATALSVFQFRASLRVLSSDTFDEWIAHLLSVGSTDTVLIALALFSRFYRDDGKQDLPVETAREIVTHDAFFTADAMQSNSMALHYWQEVATAVVARSRALSEELARRVLAHLHVNGTVAARHYASGIKVLDAIMKQDRHAGWKLVAEQIRFPMDDRTFYIQQWLHGMKFSGEDDGAVLLFDPQTILSWIEEDVEHRARFVAGIAPKVLTKETSARGLTRELLIRYGERDDVRGALHANLMTDMWWGSEAAHWQGQKEHFLAAKAGETDLGVLQWIDEMIESLDRHIEDAIVREERETY